MWNRTQGGISSVNMPDLIKPGFQSFPWREVEALTVLSLPGFHTALCRLFGALSCFILTLRVLTTTHGTHRIS